MRLATAGLPRPAALVPAVLLVALGHSWAAPARAQTAAPRAAPAATPPAAAAPTAAPPAGAKPSSDKAKLHVRIGPGRGAGERRLDAPEPARPAEPTVEERPREEGGDDDPELSLLREAERQLFPEPRQRSPVEFDAALPMSIARPGPTLELDGLPPAETPSRGAKPNSLIWPRELTPSDLPCSFEQRTLDYLKFYRDSLRGRAITEVWARRSGRFGALIQAELVKAGLPSDLLWLSLVESSHQVSSRSHAGAVGLWQFIPETARLYGLTVDRWVDERLDPLRSTQAAAQYLGDLWRRFGSWELAMAAYNMGGAGLSRSIRKYNSNDYWRLSRLEAGLPWETALYVPKVLATALVMKNRRAFGFADVQPDAPLSFDTVYVTSGVPLARIAQHAGSPDSVIQGLNLQYLKGRTPPASAGEAPRLWPVYVPEGQGAAVTRKLAQAETGPSEYATVRIRLGDSVAGIAQRLRGSEAELRTLNRLEPAERLRAGELLLVPHAWVTTQQGQPLAPLEDVESVVVLPPFRFQYEDRLRYFYRTAPGDDLGELASLLGVRRDDLVVWNALDPGAALQSDMVLQVFVPPGSATDRVRLVSERNVLRPLEVGSPSFLAHFEAEQGRQRLQILAREGDTLQAIGKRYALSPGMMERINHFGRDRRLNEGAAVVVYAKEGVTASEMLWSRAPDPLPPVSPPYPAALPAAGLPGSSRR